MGRTCKRFNEKGRRKNEIQIKQPKEQVLIDSKQLHLQQSDSANALVLPSKKRQTKNVTKNQTPAKVISKRQRKYLEYVVQHEKKKARRADILESLKNIQDNSSYLQHMQTISSVQTKGLKRLLNSVKQPTSCAKRPIRNREDLTDSRITVGDSDPAIVGVDVVDDDDSTSSSESDDEKNEIKTCNETNAASHKESDELPSNSNRKDKSEDATAHNTSSSKSPQPTVDPGIPLGLEFTAVCRSSHIQRARLALPILAEEQVIVEAIRENPVVILAGETGSGKTTQVPQFLYEAGYASQKMIAITEPRRVAAISMSKRVAEEMNLSSDVVSYQIRFEGNTSGETRIKFMTDGVLLREIERDFLLTKYSVVILDEAHERSVFTDILIGLLSRIINIRNKRGSPLRLAIMSATLRVQDFTENKRLFVTPPPVIKVRSRQFSVTIHWNKKTPDDYLAEALKKACKIHTSLPAGGILIFVTGQNEVNYLVRQLKSKFPMGNATSTSKSRKIDCQRKPISAEESTTTERLSSEGENCNGNLTRNGSKNCVRLPHIDLDEYSVQPPQEDAEDLLEGSDDSDTETTDHSRNCRKIWPKHKYKSSCSQPLDVRPLYAMLSSEKQSRVFSPVSEGCRLCVVATNVAETSLTIPGIRYVIDTGKVKQKLYDKSTGVSAFRVMWESRAAADQRAGRAGRQTDGHCYRLFSSAVYNDEFLPFAPAEIQRRPIDDVLLQMKAMCIDRVANFPFPSPPSNEQLLAAENRLVMLGALEPVENSTGNSKIRKNKVLARETRITPLGRAMACFPLTPRYAKMLALSNQQGLLPYTVCLVAALSVPQLLLGSNGAECDWVKARHRFLNSGDGRLLGDAMLLLRAVGAAEFADCDPDYCRRYGLREQAVREVRRLRIQLTNQINLILPSADLSVNPRMPPPNALQCLLLRQLLLASLPDHVARLVDITELGSTTDKDQRARWRHAYRCSHTDHPVRIHSDSVLCKKRPTLVVYQEIFEGDSGCLLIRGVTAIEPQWLPELCTDQCQFSCPLSKPAPYYNPAIDGGRMRCFVTATFGALAFPLGTVEIDYPAGIDRFRQFAVYLLKGHVAQPLLKFSANLLAPAEVMTRSWAHLQPRADTLLKALLLEKCDCGSVLSNVWKRQPRYLLDAYNLWLPESLHEQVAAMWPPLLISE